MSAKSFLSALFAKKSASLTSALSLSVEILDDEHGHWVECSTCGELGCWSDLSAAIHACSGHGFAHWTHHDQTGLLAF